MSDLLPTHIYSKPASEGVSPDDPALVAIHENIKAYCEAHHHFGFDPANPVVRLHEPTFGANEIIAAIDVLLSTRVTMGPKVTHSSRNSPTRSDSRRASAKIPYSANLLAIAALSNVATRDRLKPGDEVIVPALCWSTTVWPLVQHQLVPVIVDIDPVTLNIDPAEIERAIGPKTRAVMRVHVDGNPCDMTVMMDLCRRHSLVLIEDCCESLGAYYYGTPVGRFGRASTFSFYFSHHMTTLEGGMCVTGGFRARRSDARAACARMVRGMRRQETYYPKYAESTSGFSSSTRATTWASPSCRPHSARCSCQSWPDSSIRGAPISRMAEGPRPLVRVLRVPAGFAQGT